MVFVYPKSIDKRSFPDLFPSQNFHPTSLDSNNDSLYYDPNNKNLIVITSSSTNQKETLVEQFFFCFPYLIGNFFRTSSSFGTDSSTQSTEDTNDQLVQEKFKYAPNCSEFLPLKFSMSTFEHLPVGFKLKMIFK